MSRTRLSATSLVALAFAAFLASLSLVTWRQSRALDALAQLDSVQRQRSLSEADQAELIRHIQYLEGRGRVVDEAAAGLGLHIAGDGETVLLLGATS